MMVLLLALMLEQGAPCERGAAGVTAASERVAAFDLPGAAQLAARAAGCPEADVAFWYLRGLIAARDAYRFGGSPESLEPVRAAATQLSGRAREMPAAEIARVVLLAAAAAAQSEREEMALFLDHALRLEELQVAAGLPGAPMVTAHEAAGDLWLQVHRFEDARLAYVKAARVTGVTRRVTLGLARAAYRMKNDALACAEYRTLVAGWRAPGGEPPEIAEARAVARTPACDARSEGPGRR